MLPYVCEWKYMLWLKTVKIYLFFLSGRTACGSDIRCTEATCQSSLEENQSTVCFKGLPGILPFVHMELLVTNRCLYYRAPQKWKMKILAERSQCCTDPNVLLVLHGYSRFCIFCCHFPWIWCCKQLPPHLISRINEHTPVNQSTNLVANFQDVSDSKKMQGNKPKPEQTSKYPFPVANTA